MEPLENQSNPRPNSAKFSDLKAIRNFRSRPFSAANKNQAVFPPRNKSKLEPNKSKSKSIPYTREELYDRAMEFKTQLNMYKEENLRLKTKIKILEKESQKIDEDNEKSSLTHILKSQLKEAQKTLDDKNTEISDLKKQSKVTRIQEIEVEMKMYIDECTRLTRMLEESLTQLSMGLSPHDLQERYVQQSVQIKKLKQEIYDMSMLGDGKDKRKKRDNLIMKMKEKIVETREENDKVKQENNRLMNEIKMIKEMVKCPNCGYGSNYEENSRDLHTLIWEIWIAIEHRKLTLETTWELLGMANLDTNLDVINDALEKLGLFFSQNELQVMHQGFQNSQKISYENFVYLMNSHKPADLVTYEQIKEVLSHFSYRLQVKRWTCDQVPHIFFQESRLYSQSEFLQILMQEPIIFDENQASLLSRFLFGPSQAMPSEECIARMFDFLEPWEVLSEAKEYEYDSELRNILTKSGKALEKECRMIDKSQSNLISFGDLQKSLEKIGAVLSDRMFDYLKLLFYTDQYTFDTVPYLNFLSAYCEIKE